MHRERGLGQVGSAEVGGDWQAVSAEPGASEARAKAGAEARVKAKEAMTTSEGRL